MVVGSTKAVGRGRDRRERERKGGRWVKERWEMREETVNSPIDYSIFNTTTYLYEQLIFLRAIVTRSESEFKTPDLGLTENL